MFQAACHHDSPFHGKNIQQGSWISNCWALGSEVSSFIVELHLCHLSNTFTMQKGSCFCLFFEPPFMLKIEGASLGGVFLCDFLRMNNLDFSGSFVGYQSRTWKDDLLTHIRGLGEIDELRPQRFATLTHLWLHRCEVVCWGDRFMDVDVFNWNVFILLLCNFVELVYMIYNVYCAYSLYIIYIITYIKFQMRASNIFLGGTECMMKVTGSILVGPASGTCHW